MKAAFSAPAYGWTSHHATRAPMPWCAEITGPDPVHRYQRRFITARVEHPWRTGDTTRPVTYWWTLDHGRLYQARWLTSTRRGAWVTRWFTVTEDGDLRDLTEEEVAAWLNANAGSALTS